MAPALTDGVPGIEARHTLTPPSPYSTFTLNDWADPTTGLTVLPHTRLQKIQGLNAKSDADDPRVNLNYQTGETAFPRIPRGKTVTYSGVVVGHTLSAMRAKIGALDACVESGLANPDPWSMVVAYNATYDPTGLTFVGYGLPVGFTCDDEQASGDLSPSPYQRAFDLSFRMRDPRWWVTSDVQSVGYAGGGGSWSGIADGTSGVLTMPGLKPSEPIFEIHGSGAGEAAFSITHAELGYQLNFTLPGALDSGDVLWVDFTSRLITLFPDAGDTPSESDYTGYIDWNTTDWFNETTGGSLLVGTNTITVVGDTWGCKATPAV